MLSRCCHPQKRKKNQDGIRFGLPRGATHLEDLKGVDYVVNVESVESVPNEAIEEDRGSLLMDHLPKLPVFVIIAKGSLRIGGARDWTHLHQSMQGMDDPSNPTF
jgi:hypothetical protein